MLNDEERGFGIENGKISFNPTQAVERLTRFADGFGITPNKNGTIIRYYVSDTGLDESHIKAAMNKWESVTNVSFQAVASHELADVTFISMPDASPSELGVTYSVLENGNYKNYIGFNPDFQAPNGGVQSEWDISTYTHEIGHLLGLDHPHYDDLEQAIYPSQPVNYFEGTQAYTVMAYEEAESSGAYHGGHLSIGPLIDDISAIQLLFGANSKYNIGNNVYSSGGVYSVWDAGGIDTFDFSAFSENEIIDLRSGHFSSIGGLTSNVSIARGVTIENVKGGSGSEGIFGNSSQNIFYISGGEDDIFGGGGYDIADFSTSASSVTIDITEHYVKASFENGVSNLHDVAYIRSSSGSDIFTFVGVGYSGNVYIDTLDGYDTIDLSGSTIVHDDDLDISNSMLSNLSDSISQPTIVYDIGLSTVIFSTGFSIKMRNVENVTFGDRTTTYIGTAASETITTQGGDSIVYAGDGDDTVIGALNTHGSRTILNGDGGIDRITAMSASIINGGDGNDDLHGSAMDDRISGGSGLNTIYAGTGNDTILGFAGNDNMDGGDGIDTYVFSAAIDKVSFYFPGDTLQISDGTSYATLRSVERVIYTNSLGFMGSQFSFDVADVIAVLSSTPGHSMTAPQLQAALYQLGQLRSYHDSIAGTQSFAGTAEDDIVEVDESFVSIDGGAGYDTLTANSENHVVTWDMTGKTMSFEGVTVLDVSTFENIVMNARKSVIIGTDGTDGIQSGPGGSIVYGNAGDDVIHGAAHAPGNSASFLYGDAGNDTITMASDDWAFGGGGNDTLTSSIEGGHLSGDSGNDTLSGGVGSDTILGGDGDDLIFGSAGSDSVDGGSGMDVLSYIHAKSGVHIGGNFVSFDKTTNYTTQPQTQYQGIEQIRGSQHDDLIDVTYAGPMDLRGLAGNDTFRLFYPSKSGLINLYGGDGVDTLDMSTSKGDYDNPVGGRVYVGFTPAPQSNGQVESGMVATDIERIIGSLGGDTFLLKSLPTDISIDGNGAPYWSLDTVDFSLADAGISGSFDKIKNVAVIRGSSYDDTIDVKDVQTVYGGEGRDVFVARGGFTRFYGGKDEYSPESEIDTADLTALTSKVTISQQSGGWYYPTMIAAVTSTGRDDFLGIDRIVAGSHGIDVQYLGPIFKGQVLGGSGDDSFTAGAGVSFDGGAGHDIVRFGASSTRMVFDGAAIVSGGSELGQVTGFEEIVGTTMDDVFRAGDGMIFRSGGGYDEFHTGRGGSTFYGEYQPYGGYLSKFVCDVASTVSICMPTASDPRPGVKDDFGNTAYGVGSVVGSSGDDLFILGTQGQGELPYRIDGGAGMDTLSLVDNAYFDATYGSFFTPGSVYTSAIISGFERFAANSGTVVGTTGSDDLIGSGTATMNGGDGNDEIWANGQSNAIGGEGHDVIHGLGSGWIDGGGGNDVIYAGPETAFAHGGAGDDVIYAVGPNTTVKDQYGINQIHVSGGAQVHFNVDSYNTLVSMKDVGGGVFEIKTGSGTTYVDGASEIYLDTYQDTSMIHLYAGLDYHDGMFF